MRRPQHGWPRWSRRLETVGLPLVEVRAAAWPPLLSLPVPEQLSHPWRSPRSARSRRRWRHWWHWLLAETARQPVLAVWEDLHWADPSTLELLDLMLGPRPHGLPALVLTARPEFHPPWAPRSYVTQLTLARLPRHQSEEMVVQVTGGKPVPAEVLAQIVAKTDGIPLFVEELVKTHPGSGVRAGRRRAAMC